MAAGIESSTTSRALPFVLQRHKTALADPDRFPDPQSRYFALEPAALRTENLPAISTVVFPFVQREPDAAAGAKVSALVFQPVVGSATRNIADAPRENATSGVTHVDSPMISGR